MISTVPTAKNVRRSITGDHRAVKCRLWIQPRSKFRNFKYRPLASIHFGGPQTRIDICQVHTMYITNCNARPSILYMHK
ncbi:hypothetical protein PILCRDRAFT_287408 [Piloderma croceum F 1598]|uniref:Uncharacterized protein n=1 Tax=Piloderma croceum (strain F 1598) TaxID=765440 RepID=A0A0C3BMG3_PILCF|nr:hypothetical protein PILCRDRAFT_287408 [Piloderma croceum F 1598]